MRKLFATLAKLAITLSVIFHTTFRSEHAAMLHGSLYRPMHWIHPLYIHCVPIGLVPYMHCVTIYNLIHVAKNKTIHFFATTCERLSVPTHSHYFSLVRTEMCNNDYLHRVHALLHKFLIVLHH